MKTRSLQTLLLLTCVALFSSLPAHAHDVIPGVSGFVGRILHPFIITEHLFCLILAGLIAGLYGPRVIWISLGLLLGGILIGFLAQSVIPIISWLWMLPLGAAMIAGLMVLSAAPIGAQFWVGIIFMLGFSVGLETDPEGVFFMDKLRTLGGLVLAGGAVLLTIGWPLQGTERSWVRILARVVSSWITAIAMLVLALSF